MVRDSADPGAAFAFVGSDGAGQTIVRYRHRAGEPSRTIPIGPTGTRRWLRLVVGTDSVYAYDSSPAAAALPGAWNFLAAVKVDLKGGAPWVRRADLGGLLVEKGSVAYSDLYRLGQLFWSERTALSGAAIPSPAAGWPTVEPSADQAAESGLLLRREGDGTAGHVDFPIQARAPGTYRFFVHLPTGNPASVSAALVLGGVQQAPVVRSNEPPGRSSWIFVGSATLAQEAWATVRLLHPGTPGLVLFGDAARAVLVPETETGVWKGPTWVRNNNSRVALSGSGLTTDLERTASAATDWNAGAWSNMALFGDGRVRFRFLGPEKRQQAGLSTTSGTVDPNTINFRFFSGASGNVQVPGSPGPVSFARNNNHWYEVERTGTQVVFRRYIPDANNVLVPYHLHFSSVAANTPLFLRGAFRDEGARLFAGRFQGQWAAASQHSLYYDPARRWVIDADPEDEIQSIFDVDMNADSDGDGLTNLQEYNLSPRTNPTKADTDGDGLPDGWEVAKGFNPVDPADGALDADGDGLSNLQEYQHGTDPHDADTDGDGLPDGWEVLYGLNPLSAPGAGEGGLDPDNDGLTNAQELAAGTNPQDPDTDGDGLEDGAELLVHLTNPTLPDSDFDGLSDHFEVHSTLGFDPNNPDSDGDGVRDWHEWRVISFDPGDAYATQAHVLPGDDFDGDGVSNLHESEDGTDPADVDDYFTPVVFDRLFGAVEGAAWTVETHGGIESSRLVRTAAAGPSGGISHHEARDGTRVRFQFLPLNPASGSADQVVVGFSHRGHPPHAPFPEAHYAAAIRLDPAGKARLLVYGSEAPGAPSFDLAESDLVELRLETGENGASPRLLHVEVNQIPVTAAPIALPDGPGGYDGFLWDHDKNPDTPDEPAPLAVVVRLPAAGAGVRNLRYRRVHDPDRENGVGDEMADAWEQQILAAYPQFAHVEQILPGADADGDGLTNLQEYRLGTDPTDPDTDGDGLPDGWEVANGLDPLLDDAGGDLDGDGLTNLQEYQLGTRADLEDSDGDGLWDKWEVDHGLNPLSPPGDHTDATADADDDGLTNLQEFQLGSNPFALSTAGDGFSDGWKHHHGISPATVLDPAADLDGDGLANAQEEQLGTNPNHPDSDGDGMGDGWEHAHGLAYEPPAGAGVAFDPLDGLDPLDPTDASLDPDGDGFTNLQEFQAGTDPHDPGSNPDTVDSDGDGMPDHWELQFGLDPNDPADADYDWDYDGLTNLQEYQLGTDPRPRWRTMPVDGGLRRSQIELPGYDPYYSTSLVGAFNALGQLVDFEFNAAAGQILMRRWDHLAGWTAAPPSFGPTDGFTRYAQVRHNARGGVVASFWKWVGGQSRWELRVRQPGGALVRLGADEGWAKIEGLQLAESGAVVALVETHAPVADLGGATRFLLRWRPGGEERLPLPGSPAPRLLGLGERGTALAHPSGLLPGGSGEWTTPMPAPLGLGPYGAPVGQFPAQLASNLPTPFIAVNRLGDWAVGSPPRVVAYGGLAVFHGGARAQWRRGLPASGEPWFFARDGLEPPGADQHGANGNPLHDADGSPLYYGEPPFDQAPVSWSTFVSGMNRQGDVVGGFVSATAGDPSGFPQSGQHPVEGYGDAFLWQRGRRAYTPVLAFTPGAAAADANRLRPGTRYWTINGLGMVLASTERVEEIFDEDGQPQGHQSFTDWFVLVPDNDAPVAGARNGLPDDWERFHFGAVGQNPNADYDEDGLSNRLELAFGTNPALWDSDGDTGRDSWEIEEGFDPLAPDVLDTDGDGLPDLWELAHGLDPHDPSDALLDLDGDGRSLLEEYRRGSDPLDYFNGRGVLLEILSGNHQKGLPGEILAVDLLVRVRDAVSGDPLVNAPVALAPSSGGGMPASAHPGQPFETSGALDLRTDDAGVARLRDGLPVAVRCRLPESPGLCALAASSGGASILLFASAADDPAAGLSPVIQLVSGDDQTGPRGSIAPVPLRVRVAAPSGAPLPNLPVTFAVDPGGPGGGAVAPGRLVLAGDAGPYAAASATLVTDALGYATLQDGLARALRFRQPGAGGTTTVTATVGAAPPAVFHFHTDEDAPETDFGQIPGFHVLTPLR